MTTFEIKKLMDKVLTKYMDSALLNIMFHSMEIIPNASPYVRSQKGQERFINKLKSIFEYAKGHNIKSQTLMEVFNGRL